MREIQVSPTQPIDSYLRRSQKYIARDGAVVLVARGTRAHRHLRRIYRSWRFPIEEINPRIFVDQQTSSWHLLLAPSDWSLHLDAAGVPKASS
jgi:hypothetical protein